MTTTPGQCDQQRKQRLRHKTHMFIWMIGFTNTDQLKSAWTTIPHTVLLMRIIIEPSSAMARNEAAVKEVTQVAVTKKLWHIATNEITLRMPRVGLKWPKWVLFQFVNIYGLKAVKSSPLTQMMVTTGARREERSRCHCADIAWLREL